MTKITKKEKSKAQKALKKALPKMVKFLEDRKFVAEAEKAGYRVDVSAVFKLFTDAAGWNLDMNKVFSYKKAENGR